MRKNNRIFRISRYEWHLQEVPRGAKMPEDGPKRPQDGPEMAPRRPQDGPKMVPREARIAPTWLQGGPQKPQDGPKRPQDGPKTTPRGPKMAPGRLQKRGPKYIQMTMAIFCSAVLESTWSNLAELKPSWGRLGAVLGPLGAVLGPLGVVLGPLGTLLGPSWSHPAR